MQPMLGNDVVDLGDADCLPGACHPRFDDRVFSPSELTVLGRSADRERTRWALWAAKESAYKAARRLDPGAIFAPSRMVVDLCGRQHATVHVGTRHFVVELVATSRYVHAVAYAAAADRARSCTAVARFSLDAAGADPIRASAAVRTLALATLAQVFEVAPEDLAIQSDRRDRRMPTLRVRGLDGPLVLSLSHHGCFVAFACALPSAAHTASWIRSQSGTQPSEQGVCSGEVAE